MGLIDGLLGVSDKNDNATTTAPAASTTAPTTTEGTPTSSSASGPTPGTTASGGEDTAIISSPANGDPTPSTDTVRESVDRSSELIRAYQTAARAASQQTQASTTSTRNAASLLGSPVASPIARTAMVAPPVVTASALPGSAAGASDPQTVIAEAIRRIEAVTRDGQAYASANSERYETANLQNSFSRLFAGAIDAPKAHQE